MQRETIDKANEILNRIAQVRKYLEELEKIEKAAVPVCIEIWTDKDEREEIRQMKLRKIQRPEKELEELKAEKEKAENKIIGNIETYDFVEKQIKKGKEIGTHMQVGETLLVLAEDIAECILDKREERVKELEKELENL